MSNIKEVLSRWGFSPGARVLSGRNSRLDCYAVCGHEEYMTPEQTLEQYMMPLDPKQDQRPVMVRQRCKIGIQSPYVSLEDAAKVILFMEKLSSPGPHTQLHQYWARISQNFFDLVHPEDKDFYSVFKAKASDYINNNRELMIQMLEHEAGIRPALGIEMPDEQFSYIGAHGAHKDHCPLDIVGVLYGHFGYDAYRIPSRFLKEAITGTTKCALGTTGGTRLGDTRVSFNGCNVAFIDNVAPDEDAATREVMLGLMDSLNFMEARAAARII